ncbi:MAG: IS66 family transposase [Verrucomicrobia bacterium]|nr:IS66 family transposase [Verrucomicrobiota bacterium]
MPIEGLDRKQLEELAEADVSVSVSASSLLALVVKLERLEEEIVGLKRTSRTSSKPPSSDRNNPNKPDKKKRTRKGGKRKRKPGAQKGHQGKTLKQVANPDKVVVHPIDGKCAHCDTDLHGVQGDGYEKRQVFDLPEKITMEVTEHRAEKGTCPCCAKPVKATFPENVNAPVQYGERTQSMVLYLQTYQLLPCERLSELFTDVFDCNLSTGTICRMLERSAEKTAPIIIAIKEKIREGPYIHSDETGMSLSGKIHWLHTASNSELTYLYVDRHRGEPAMRAMGVLEGYTGFVIHDYLSSYYRITGILHGLCNVHHIRDLICVHEEHGQQWASDMIKLLLEAKTLKDRERDGGRCVGQRTLNRLQNRYFEILDDGYILNPEPERRPGQRGKLKRGKPLNMLNRFHDRHLEVMAFLIHGVPFDNNQAERDLRMMKIKQKISGCFRNLDQAQAFAALRSIISSAKKQTINVLQILQATLSNPGKAQEMLLGT